MAFETSRNSGEFAKTTSTTNNELDRRMVDTLEEKWLVPPSDLALPNDEIHVWRASLNVFGENLRYLQNILSQDELRRARHSRFEKNRKRFILARGLLRIILSRYVHIAPDELRFTYNRYGKPAMDSMAGQKTLRFNLSHSGDWILYAIRQEQEVGIDIERIRNIRATWLAESIFSVREYAVFRSLPEHLRQQAFFTCWTRKEAFVKGIGQGLSYPLNQFSVSMIPGEPAKLLNCPDYGRQTQSWDLTELTLDARYVAALAFEGCSSNFRCFQWQECSAYLSSSSN